MKEKVLVSYASNYGSTQEVAEAVAAALRDRAVEVDLQPLRKVQTLDGYTAVIMGAPLFMFHWHKEALHFLSRHRDALLARPLAVFALGPFHDTPDEWKTIRAQLDNELAKFPWLKPADIAIFGAKFDPATLRFPLNLLPALKQMPASDLRDWAAIRSWAVQVHLSAPKSAN